MSTDERRLERAYLIGGNRGGAHLGGSLVAIVVARGGSFLFVGFLATHLGGTVLLAGGCRGDDRRLGSLLARGDILHVGQDLQALTHVEWTFLGAIVAFAILAETQKDGVDGTIHHKQEHTRHDVTNHHDHHDRGTRVIQGIADVVVLEPIVRSHATKCSHKHAAQEHHEPGH